MSNRKKGRMDAIERRLATLEAHSRPDVDYLLDKGWSQIPHPGKASAEGQWWKVKNPHANGDYSAVQYAAVKRQREWDAEADPPEFSCQPTAELPDDFPADDDTARWIRIGQTVDVAARAFPPSEVRERVRERSDLADALADVRGLYATDCDDADLLHKAAYEITENRAKVNLDHEVRRALAACQSHMRIPNIASAFADAARFEDSLRALLAIVQPEAPPIEAADAAALIEGCLAGGTITPEGLQHAE